LIAGGPPVRGGAGTVLECLGGRPILLLYRCDDGGDDVVQDLEPIKRAWENHAAVDGSRQRGSEFAGGKVFE
jgi:hypothetical protein